MKEFTKREEALQGLRELERIWQESHKTYARGIIEREDHLEILDETKRMAELLEKANTEEDCAVVNTAIRMLIEDFRYVFNT